jgi:hypothetical protein
MHGADYRPEDWISVIHLAVDDAMSYGVDELHFITGQGVHSGDSGPVLRPLTVAVLLRMNLPAVIDGANAGLVRCELGRSVTDEQVTDPTVAELMARLPEYSAPACQALLAFAFQDIEEAIAIAERIDRAMRRSWSDFVSKADQTEFLRQNRSLFQLKKQFPGVPVEIVKKVALDVKFQMPQGQAKLRQIEAEIKGIEPDILVEVFNAVPNLPIDTIVRAVKTGGGTPEGIQSVLLAQSVNGFQNARGAFKFNPALRGKRRDGSERTRPILELDVSGAERERAERNVRRVVTEMLAGDYQYGEIRFRTSWLNPRDVTVEWVAALIRDIAPGVVPMKVGPVVKCKLAEV